MANKLYNTYFVIKNRKQDKSFLVLCKNAFRDVFKIDFGHLQASLCGVSKHELRGFSMW